MEALRRWLLFIPWLLPTFLTLMMTGAGGAQELSTLPGDGAVNIQK